MQTTPMTQITLNAHLLSVQSGYRSAGIHSYVRNLLANLPSVAPSDWRFKALVGRAMTDDYPGMTMVRSNMDTSSPSRRIVWEQLAQPWALKGADLYHALAFVGPLWLRVPTVVTVYDLSFIHYPQRLPAFRRLYLQFMTALTCRRARRILAISQSTADDVTRLYGISKDRIDVTPCGFDKAQFYPRPADEVTAFRRARNLPERFWLFIGTLEPRKNLTTLFEAYAALPPSDRLPLIVGGGKGWLYDEIFASVERLGLQTQIQFPGFIASDELPLWYNSAETFVYPSVYEGFGLPVLEAMACGTPVVASDASSLPEVMGNAGLKVAPRDVEAWTAALKQAAHDAQWRADARKCGLDEAAPYDWRNTASQTIMAYQRALQA